MAVPLCLPTSLRRVFSWPISLNSADVFRVRLPASGVGCCAAAIANSPNVADLAPCDTTPSLTVISLAGTCHCAAAADTSMDRAAAPAWRICIKLLAIAVLPPVPCCPINRLAYLAVLAGACSHSTWLQAASNSSAIQVARPV